jgi:tetratricopeptide (TPR) repeat protein
MDKYKKVFDKFEDQNTFIKTTKKSIDSSQKAALNRQGNMLFNAGKIEEAKKIFLVTGYSDGLSRIGDAYKKENRHIEALNMYQIAPNPKKFEAMVMELSTIIKNLIKEDEG